MGRGLLHFRALRLDAFWEFKMSLNFHVYSRELHITSSMYSAPLTRGQLLVFRVRGCKLSHEGGSWSRSALLPAWCIGVLTPARLQSSNSGCSVAACGSWLACLQAC